MPSKLLQCYEASSTYTEFKIKVPKTTVLKLRIEGVARMQMFWHWDKLLNIPETNADQGADYAEFYKMIPRLAYRRMVLFDVQ